MATLVDYWAADASTAERFEEHAFACDECFRRLEAIATLARGVARVATMPGGMGMVVTQALINRLLADGLRMRHYRVQPGETVQCRVGPEDDLSVTYLSAELHDVPRVDVVLYAYGSEWASMDDASIDRVTGQVIYTTGGDLARTFPAITVRVELRAPRNTATRESWANTPSSIRPTQAKSAATNSFCNAESRGDTPTRWAEAAQRHAVVCGAVRLQAR